MRDVDEFASSQLLFYSACVCLYVDFPSEARECLSLCLVISGKGAFRVAPSRHHPIAILSLGSGDGGY